MGPPRSGDGSQGVLVGEARQSVCPLNRPADTQVAHRQHVGAPQMEDQEHVGAPATEALDGCDLPGDLLVGELVESVKLELPALHAGGEVAQVPYLLPREPDLP